MSIDKNKAIITPVEDSASRHVVLKDGRKLGYAEYGVPNGTPVFYFHGNPSSRLEGWRMDEPAKQMKSHIISIDRPGFGLSDFKLGRRLLDWPDDVIQLADNLGINQFAIIGASGGGPYAMACAYKIPQRLTAVALVSSPCPFDVPAVTGDLSRFQRLAVFVVRRALWLARIRLGILSRKIYRDPVRVISRVNGEIADVDKAILKDTIIRNPKGLNRAVATLQQAFRLGARGVTLDYSLVMNSWGFRPEDISIQIKLWHGEADMAIPPSMGRYLADAIPNCQANFIPYEGHYMIVNHVQDILGDLVK